MLKVNVYMETDNGSKGTLYRGYGAVVEFVRRDGTPEIRTVSGMLLTRYGASGWMH